MAHGQRQRGRTGPSPAGTAPGLSAPGTTAAPAPGTSIRGTHGAIVAGTVENLHQHFPGTRAVARLDRRRPVGQWSARQLGVHPAIHGTGTPGDNGGFVLPEYVARDHDRGLRDRLRRAADRGHPVLVLVRGPSSAGKTRTAFEAVRACLRDWELVFPKTPGGLAALLDAGALVPRTVLWLNEAQNHFASPAGEEAAAALHRRLEEPGPLVVLGTLWPEYHRRLTATPEPGTHAADAHPHARALLGQAAVVDVPASFTAEALADPLLGRDPSLAAAAATSTGGQVTQTLAAGPQLVDHYRQPTGPHGPYGRAVITAAMDARRLGHSSRLPDSFLKAAASGYLSGEQRAAADPATWFAGALAYARERVKGVAAALGPVAGPEGMGALPDVHGLNDYLDHHARTARRRDVPPASFWTAVRDHVTDAADLSALAEAACSRGRYRIGAGLYRKAADAGDTSALGNLAWLRTQAGDTDEAERLYRQALAAGHPEALTDLARLREETGDPEGAERLAWQAADAGDIWALVVLAQVRERAGDFDGAERLAHRAARAGSYTVARHLVRLRDTRDPEDAERLALEVDFDGKSRVHSNLWYVRGESMDDEDWERTEGESLYRSLVDSGDVPALSRLARLREKAGNPGAAERLYRRAADAGDTSALGNLAWLRTQAGDTDEAERLYRQALAAGHIEALTDLARLYEEKGDAVRAERLGRFGVDAGGSQAGPW
nr:tetratricopeptide repeat protein [Streptomyces phytophilus]